MTPVLIQRTKKTLLILGIALLIGSVILAVALAAGLLQLPETLIAAESTVHSVARIAIVGCLLAALGSMD